MKLNFDPKSNIRSSDYSLIKLNKVNKIKDLLKVRSIVKNWPTVLAFRTGLKNANFIMELRNGIKVKITNPNDYFSWWETIQAQNSILQQAGLDKAIQIDKNKKIIKFKFKSKPVHLFYDSDKQLSNTIGMVREQFLEEQYKWLNVKGKDVIDIGANIGDSAIYFALNGAKHVYAFEPYPYSYKVASNNIKLNKLNKRITLLNEGCSDKEGGINIKTDYQNFGGTDLKEFNKETKINLTTLKGIINRFNIKSPAILKIDCEGCEYSVLLNANNSDLKKFEQIQIEYHYGYLNLKKKLIDAGFEVKNNNPKQTFNKLADNKELFIGLIYAKKNSE
ncbi:SAM-dependent methyltransferase [Candidatus Mancarchaeum acidiphilum]|uniref:SAM-dependent methyltransferase n=1 Tax=Candidatus Mancarchaeum acidiphilum TaxID=1920749 RepID=A0A218NMQ2_9ARCH|nr:FkbM family methyltransferase [Candidatus Mancarchaeum acidiphilum]ASI13759.1 SAM-dependent methyltransferase [Candidatus Mancarchaeum acidiphilum]